jgi:hypothetical protein
MQPSGDAANPTSGIGGAPGSRRGAARGRWRGLIRAPPPVARPSSGS